MSQSTPVDEYILVLFEPTLFGGAVDHLLLSVEAIKVSTKAVGQAQNVEHAFEQETGLDGSQITYYNKSIRRNKHGRLLRVLS